MGYLLKVFVLDPIISMSEQVTQMYTESNFRRRIKITGNDELSKMGGALNSLMEIIEITQDQLKYRIVQRTEKLDRLSGLNKNLFSEISQQKNIEFQLRENEKLLRQMAYYDNLTALPNRIFFNELLQKALDHAQKEGTQLAVLFLDADKFKSINDTYGHAIGDYFLKVIAERLRTSIRECDVAARLAGDEFILFLTDVKNRDTVINIADQIQKSLAVSMDLGQLDIKATFSIGISMYPTDGTTVEELERHADLAMYYVKKQARASYYFYDMIKSQDSLSEM